MRILCAMGFHKWVYRQPVFSVDPKQRIKYPKVCKRCEREVVAW